MDNSKKLLETFQFFTELPTLPHRCNYSKTCKLILGRDTLCVHCVSAPLRLNLYTLTNESKQVSTPTLAIIIRSLAEKKKDILPQWREGAMDAMKYHFVLLRF